MDLTQWAVPWIIVVFSIGLILLLGGGHWLVRGSSHIARMLGIHPIIVGLTVVALGTSMPEFLVSLIAAIKDKPDLALGNIVGSNISNIGLILGVSALARPIAINPKLLKREALLVLVVSIFFWVFCFNGLLGRYEGLLLLLAFSYYMYRLVSGARDKSNFKNQRTSNDSELSKTIGSDLVYIVLGIIALSVGADWTINSASEISRRLGVSELILGLTIIAIGTSLPELATSLVATIKKEGDISIGNIIGSNLFNMMAVAGPTALIHPLEVSKSLVKSDMPIMIGLTILLYLFMSTGKELTRKEGGLLLLCYIGIIMWWTL